MSLNAEAGSSTADSYVSVADADAYFGALENSRWAALADADAKEVVLRKATRYLDNQYRGRFVGYKATQAQSLAWPRVAGSRGLACPLKDADGFDIAVDIVPDQIKRATLEVAALVASGVNLEPTLERGGAIKSISKQVGPIGKSITYTDGASPLDRYTAVEAALASLVRSHPGSGVGNADLVRA
jgi:hypothetical protein